MFFFFIGCFISFGFCMLLYVLSVFFCVCLCVFVACYGGVATLCFCWAFWMCFLFGLLGFSLFLGRERRFEV